MIRAKHAQLKEWIPAIQRRINGHTSGNDDGEEDLEAVQEDQGSGTITVQDSNIAGEIVADGVDLIQ